MNVELIPAALPPLATQPQDILVSTVDGKAQAITAIGRNRIAGILKRTPDSADIVLSYFGPYNTFGRGLLTPVALINVFTVGADGAFAEPWKQIEVGGGPPMWLQADNVACTPNGTQITIRGHLVVMQDTPRGTTEAVQSTAFVDTYTFDPTTNDFIEHQTPEKFF